MTSLGGLGAGIVSHALHHAHHGDAKVGALRVQHSEPEPADASEPEAGGGQDRGGHGLPGRVGRFVAVLQAVVGDDGWLFVGTGGYAFVFERRSIDR